jgi:hypothetical protein
LLSHSYFFIGIVFKLISKKDMKKLVLLFAIGLALSTTAQTVHSHTTVATRQDPDGSTHTKITKRKHVTVHHRTAATTPHVTVKKTTTSTSATVK